MDITKRLIEIAEKAIVDKLASKEGEDIQQVTTFSIDNQIMPLFIVGHVSQKIEDGSCVVLLNPEKELINRIEPSTHYPSAILKEIISKKCDCMVQIWVDAYKTGSGRLTTMSKYKSRSASKPRFTV